MLTLQLIACIGMIMGCFFVWNIRLEDFTADLFRGILGKPRNIQDAILEETNSKKMPLLKREILEVQEILSVTGREKQFPLLCTAALLFFTLGASAAILMGNFFLSRYWRRGVYSCRSGISSLLRTLSRKMSPQSLKRHSPSSPHLT